MTAQTNLTGGLRLVVTCTQRKTEPVPHSLQLRNLAGLKTVTRLDNWSKSLRNSDVASKRALDLYAGEHWDVVRRLYSHGPGAARPTEIWVCSAGYGLIPIDAQVRPYAATFSPGHPDSVPGGAKGASAWWRALATWDGPVPGTPRSLAELLSASPRKRTLLVLSQSYLAACRDDVAEALSTLPGGGEDLSIISAGTKTSDGLAERLLPVDARLQYLLGGTRQALNVRAAEHVVLAGLEDHEEMRAWLEGLVADQPALPRYDRQALNDAEVRAYIRRRVLSEPGARHTPLLRDLRRSGYACEQARFAVLFRAESEVQR